MGISPSTTSSPSHLTEAKKFFPSTNERETKKQIKMSLKSSCCSLRTPLLLMPDKDVLYRSFNQLLGSLDLCDDKIEEMNSKDDQKKWEILCSRSLMKTHQSPGFYLQRLRSHTGPKAAQSKTDVADVLRGLEVSLRTYSKDWFRSFLDEKHSLDTLVDLIELTLCSDHLHIVLHCLKTIMNDSEGLEKAINHQKLTEVLAQSLSTVSPKNKCSILQLMTIACEKSSKAYGRVLKSLRLEQLMDFLTLDSNTDQLAIVSTLNLIKAVINSPIDMNYRVYLQFEFRKSGLDGRIERLMLNESSLISEVIEEIKNYQSMIINVNQLVKDRDEIKALERLRKAGTKLMDVERQSINCERSSEVASKDGRAETSDAEILQKSSVKVAPMTNAGSDIRIAQQTVVSQSPPPPPPPPNVLMPIKKTSQMRCKLPSLNWLPLRPNQVKGTIFNGLNDERLRKIINFTHFEDKFRCDILQSSTSTPLANRLRMPTYITLLEPTRLRNVAILRRKLNFDADSVIEVINDYKINQLDLDSVQILTNLAPRDSETDSYRSYLREKKDDGILSNEDKFLLKLSQVDRLTSKLCVMAFLGNFEDLADSLSIQLCAVNSTSMSLKSSKKFRSVLEIILTFGNYMNSNKSSGAAYGFRLKGAFERLSDTRSNDKKQTLMEFIVETITEKFSSLLNLDSELLCITESARISMKNVTTEIESIQSDWCQLINEIQCSKHATLKAFEAKALPKFNKLTNELDTTRSNYNECLSYFGEDSAEATDSNEFFSVICKFVSQFKVIAGKVKL